MEGHPISKIPIFFMRKKKKNCKNIGIGQDLIKKIILVERKKLL